VYPHIVAGKRVGEDTERSYSACRRKISQNASRTKNRLIFSILVLSFLVQAFIDENVMSTAGGFVCKPCSKVLSKRSIHRHAEEMHVNVGIAYQCPLCKSVKNTKNAIQLHVGRKHPELKGVNINQCQLK
jgi:hypothetical protein